jgi:hypothetical protein
MAQNFAKYAGIIQLVLGALGQFVPDIGSALGAGSGGSIFNMLSGAALGYLGFKGSPGAQVTGAKALGGVNALIGLLGIFGISNIAGIQLNEGLVAKLVNLAIGAWGLFAGFSKK